MHSLGKNFVELPLRLVDLFIRGREKLALDELWRSRVLIFVGLSLFAVSFPIARQNLNELGVNLQSVALVGLSLHLGMAPIYLLVSVGRRTATWLFIAGYFAFFFIVSYINAASPPVIAPVLALLPVVAAYLIDTRAGLVWFAAVLVTAAFVVVINQFGFAPAVPVGAIDPFFGPYAALFGVFAINALMIWSIELVRRISNAHQIAQEEIRSNEERWRNFASSASDRLWETDENHRFTFISPALGNRIPSEELVGKTRWEVPGLNSDDPSWTRYKADLDARRPIKDFLIRQSLEDGSEIWVRTAGSPIFDEAGKFKGYRGTNLDVTAEVLAQQRDQISRNQFLNALEQAPQGVVYWGSDQRLVVCNTEFKSMYSGIEPFTLPGTAFESFVSACEEVIEFPQYGRSKDDWHRHVIERYQHSESDFELRFGDRDYLLNRKCCPDGSYIVFHSDITELKLREEELYQAQKMEAIGHLTGGVAHDFNNLLAALMANLEIIKFQAERPDIIRERVSKALKSVERGATITGRLLAFSRRQPLHPEAIWVTALLEEMEDLFLSASGEKYTIRWAFPPEPWQIFVDRNQLETALLNLILNARDAMIEGGEIFIECLNIHVENLTVFDGSELSDGDYVQLSISDSGHGISSENLSRVLEPFFTTKGVGEGSGLGLSMAFGFIKQSGGDITITSEPDRGTTVTIYLPRCTTEPVVTPEKRTPISEEIATGTGEKIVLIEDDEAVRDSITILLRQLGYEVINGFGDDCSKFNITSYPEAQLLLFDVVLPNGTSGPKLIEKARRVNPGIRALLMTGYSADHVDLQTDEVNICPLLFKPLNPHELAKQIRIALDS